MAAKTLKASQSDVTTERWNGKKHGKSGEGKSIGQNATTKYEIWIMNVVWSLTEREETNVR